MKNLQASISIKVDDRIFLKDPETSEIGRNIISNGILLIDELGLESFTFRKLAERIGTTEATIYRYFESKHKLLIYLISWYWSWQEYRLMYAVNNIDDPAERLKIAIRLVSGAIINDMDFLHIDEGTLQRIVIAESSKVYLTKEVDADNKEGFFFSYKRICRRIGDMITEINPNYPYPASLVSTIAESAHHQKFFAKHLPSLSNISAEDDDQLVEFLTDLVFKAICKT